MKIFCSKILATTLTICSVALHGQTKRSATKPNDDRSTAARAMDVLVGKSLYECASEANWIGSHLFDGTKSDGTQVERSELRKYFGPGHRMIIRAAETDMKLVDGAVFPSVQVVLNVEELNSNTSAGLVIEVYLSNLTASRIYAGLLSTGRFTEKPVTGIRIGMTRDDLECLLGRPDHTNYDARSGEQMVYANGTYVYVDKRGRVVNFQTTY